MSEVDKEYNAKMDRKAAIELAISEIAAYKHAVLEADSTDRLIKSAAAIQKYIETAELPN